MSARKLVMVGLTGAYLLMWIGGVGHYVLLGGPPLDAPWTASLFLLLAGAVVVATSGKRELRALLTAALVGFAAEVLGVKYGFIFSPYRYTETLRPQLFGVPLVMLSAWMVLVAYTRQLWMKVHAPGWIGTWLAAGWMTAIDLVIDPLAANRLDYWRWVETGAYYGIPVHNFAGWLAVSLVIFSLVRRPVEENRWARSVGLSIVLFFTAIALASGLILAGGIGIALSLVQLLVWRTGRLRSPAGLASEP
ncbi:MAG TPA: carotenoid biosynthesis protein [Blastocatellia bacterium]|nr:carotenoid biosynthesis protein [Blastocatellia bacterium]